jgi:hypothetical protein
LGDVPPAGGVIFVVGLAGHSFPPRHLPQQKAIETRWPGTLNAIALATVKVGAKN